MNKKNTAIGIVLILLGLSMYLKNFNVETGSLMTLFLGLGLSYAYYIKREQPFIIFGGIFTAIGAVSLLHDIRLFRLDITFETLLLAVGIIFLLIYHTRKARGFIIPGMLLLAVGVYLILLRSMSDKYASPSIFLLLGFAFYAIYLIEYMGTSNWPLIPATILLSIGILSYAFSFKVITWSMIYLRRAYILPLLLIAAGIMVLMSLIRRRS